jgi:hypothetical protein
MLNLAAEAADRARIATYYKIERSAATAMNLILTLDCGGGSGCFGVSGSEMAATNG